MGNPVAVVICTSILTSSEMQQIATWFNLSETTFVTDIEESKFKYKTRIFSPDGEMPFAGHPTLGTASAVRKHINLVGKKVQQNCPGGLIDIRFENENVYLKSPKPKLKKLLESQIIELNDCFSLGDQILKAAIIEIGPVWITALIESSKTIENLRVNFESIKSFSDSLNATGVVLGAVQPDKKTLKVRTFAPSVGVPEDPVCGSGNIALALLRKEYNFSVSNYLAKQGQEVGRDGEVLISYLDDSGIELGGKTNITAVGKLSSK